MKIKFVSDLHLGKAPQSHSTPDSRKRFQAALYEAAMRAARPTGQDLTVCLGDLFDKPSNPEAVIKQGADVAHWCNHVIAGNHDLHGREGVMPSLRLLADMLDDAGRIKYVFDTTWRTLKDGDTALCLIPHQPSQAAFEEELDLAQETAPQYRHGTKILCLHANYDSPFTEGSEASLNLTRGRAAELLEAFDQIVMGHEHTSRTDFGGRLVVVGSLLPTDFGNVSDKYVWGYNTKTRKMEAEMFWDEAVGSRVVDWKDAEGLGLGGVQFVDVLGGATPSEMPSVAAAVQTLWKTGADLLMVKNSVTVEGEAVQASEAHKSLDVVDRIRQELAGSDLGGLFEQYLGR
jgi:DNA repair exonuclease SbcCD nuclease subunit